MRGVCSVLYLSLALLALLTGCPDPAPPGGVPPASDASVSAADASAEDSAAALDPEAARWRKFTHPEGGARPGPLSEADQTEIKALIEALPGDLGHEVTALVAYGPGIEPHVAPLLDDAAPQRRVQGVQLVAKLRIKDLYKKVASMVDDKDERVRRAVIDMIGAQGDIVMVRRLSRFIEDSGPSSRMRATRTMSEHGERQIVAALRKRAEVETRVWRLRTLEALIDLSHPEDFKWYQAEHKAKDGKQSYNESVGLWRGMAASDPVKTWSFLKAERKRKGERFSERVYFTTLMHLAPHVPEADLVALATEKIEGRYRPRMRHLIRALALTPGDAAAAEVTKLLARDLYACDILGARLEREAELTRRIKRLEAAVASPPEGASKGDLEARLLQSREELAWLGPQAENALSKLKVRLASQTACRGELGSILPQRLTALLPALKEPTPKSRSGAALLLARHGQWSHIPELMTVLWDEDAKVRSTARDALRKIVGHDLRMPGGYAWDTFYVRSFGAELPAASFPAADKAKTHDEDYQRSLTRRPPAAKPSTAGAGIKGPPKPRVRPDKLKDLKVEPVPQKGEVK